MAISSPDPFRCEVCGAALANAEELVEHREGHAEKAAEGAPEGAGAPTLHCAVCGATFGSPELVKAHHQSAHGM